MARSWYRSAVPTRPTSIQPIFTVTRQKTPALTSGDTQALRGHLRCQVPVLSGAGRQHGLISSKVKNCAEWAMSRIPGWLTEF